MLKQRIATGVILVAAFLAALFSSQPLVFVAFCASMIVIACWEWAAFAECNQPAQRLTFTAVVLLGMAAVFYGGGFYADAFNLETDAALPTASSLLTLFYFAAAFWLFVLLVLITYPASGSVLASRGLRLLLGVLTLTLAWAALLVLRYHPYGQFWVIYLFAVVACADIGAYFAGKAFGRRKLAPEISPGKSWEGFFGGLAVALLFALVLGQWFAAQADNPLPELRMLLIVTALVAGASVLGDLFESVLKRRCGIKDSGNILPGHGGVMDRIDGLTAALPMLALILLAQGW